MNIQPALATNPLIMDQFTADPTARVFEGKLYVYPSHDIKALPGFKGKADWFVMPDYHVFSSDNLTDWKDHGMIVWQRAWIGWTPMPMRCGRRIASTRTGNTILLPGHRQA